MYKECCSGNEKYKSVESIHSILYRYMYSNRCILDPRGQFFVSMKINRITARVCEQAPSRGTSRNGNPFSASPARLVVSFEFRCFTIELSLESLPTTVASLALLSVPLFGWIQSFN